jgi:hypothetical protein
MKFEVPGKLIKLVVLILSHTRTGVKIKIDFAEEFILNCGVKQGVSLSATFFNLVIGTILKQMKLRRNITTRLKQCTAYADDTLLTPRTKQSFLKTFQKRKETLAQYGLL